jgi:hypothetical protein
MGNFDQINSATKYPSIETYHKLDPANGILTEEATDFKPRVVLATEKVNGENGRIVVMPNGDWFIGSREELIYARGDRIIPATGGIVPTLLPLVDNILHIEKSGLGAEGIEVYFFEVYGHRIGGAAKNYTKTEGMRGARLFDVCRVPNVILEMPREAISGWRQRGGQKWQEEKFLQYTALEAGLDLVPRISEINARDMPVTIDDTAKFLNILLPRTGVALDDTGMGRGEGIVFRIPDRSVIVKARFEDYERTLRLRDAPKRQPRKWK